jgi:hypothetical protein
MPRRSCLPALLALALGGGALTLAPPVRADDAEAVNEARAKFQRGLELEQAGDFGGAVTLFREVGQVRMTPQVRYHIATCEEGLGKLVAALGGYELALAQSTDMPPDFVAEVQKAVDDLRARIPKLVIERGDGADAASVELDGVALGGKKIGQPVPLDPGPHTVTAKAPGRAEFSETVVVEEGNVARLLLELSPLETASTGPGAETTATEEPKGFGIWPWVIGGVGVAAAGAGAVLLPVSQGKASDAEALCGGTDCTALGDTDADAWREAQSLVSDAQTLEAVGWVSIGVGVAALGTGVVLLLVDPTRGGESAPAPEARVGRATVALHPAAAGADAGLSLLGRF